MSKQYYGVIKLARHIPAWCDMVNNIHLTCNGRWFKCVTDDMDLKPIMKGIKAGLIEWTTVEEIGTGEDEGAKLPEVTFSCHCIVDKSGMVILEEGVLAPYDPEFDKLPEDEVEEKPEDPEVPDQPEEPPVEEEESSLDLIIKHNDVEVEEVIIERGIVELKFDVEIKAENCKCEFEHVKFDVKNKEEGLEGFEGEDAIDCDIVDGVMHVKNLVQPKNFKECEIAVIRVRANCGCEEAHEVVKEIKVRVKAAKMFFDECAIIDVHNPDELEVQGLDFILAGLDMEVGPVDLKDLDEDENAGTFQGNYVLFAPEEAKLQLEAWDVLGAEFAIEEPGCIVVNGVNYKVQYLDLLTGKNGVTIKVTEAN